MPLALFHDAQDDKGFDDGTIVPCSEADHKVLKYHDIIATVTNRIIYIIVGFVIYTLQ